MRPYFNDLSCGNPAISLSRNFDKVIRFFDLVELLKTNYGLGNVVIDGSLGALQLCDTLVAECYYSPVFGFDQRNLVQQLGNYFSRKTEMDKAHVFMHEPTGRRSVLLGNAHEYSSPSISFTFDKEFETPVIKGERCGQEAEIYNLYDRDQAFRLSNFVSRHDCKPYNPVESPLWNTGATGAYHKSVKEKLDSIKEHPGQNIAILSECADVVAQLNGWELDEGLTKRNKTATRYRRIYRPCKYPRKNAYLSIDFEKPEIYFELHDKRGRHIGEYRWDGFRSGDADITGGHDIKVC